MITAGDFRNGVTFEMDGQVMQVVEFQHVKPGKGAAFVRTKMNINLIINLILFKQASYMSFIFSESYYFFVAAAAV